MTLALQVQKIKVHGRLAGRLVPQRDAVPIPAHPFVPAQKGQRVGPGVQNLALRVDAGHPVFAERYLRAVIAERPRFLIARFDLPAAVRRNIAPKTVFSGGVQIAVFGGFHLFGKAGPVQAGDPDDLAGFRDVQRIQRQRIRRREQKPRLHGPCVPPGKQDIEQRRRAP